jgi:twitching motility protein PilT
MLNSINQSVAERIATIEEPARYFFPKAKALVDQKQVAIDTPDFGQGLEQVLRSGSRVVSLGEVADVRAFSMALEAAGTNLVFCRVSAVNPPEAIRTIVGQFGPAEQLDIRARLANHLKGMIFTKTLPRKSREGEVVMAAAALQCDPSFQESIVDADWDMSVTKALVQNRESRETLEESVAALFKKSLVDEEILRQVITWTRK